MTVGTCKTATTKLLLHAFAMMKTVKNKSFWQEVVFGHSWMTN